MKNSICIILFLGCLFCSAQTIKVTAEHGDGIFSLLRKQGLDPSKYYAEFIALNESNIKNGSELHLGREYLIPDAPDSFKKMAVNADEDLKKDRPIFNEELAQINHKSDQLKDAVLYLLPGINGVKNSAQLKEVRNQIMRNVAKELMVHGARVYLVEELGESGSLTSENMAPDVENTIADRNQMEHFVGTINRHYLQNAGKYQRVVVLNFNDTAASSSYYDIGFFHHEKSAEGEHFARTFERIFKKKSVQRSSQTPIDIFENTNNLYLAKNVLPAVTMIDISGSDKKNTENKISIRPRDKELANMITNGVLSDYANLSIED